MKLHLFAIILTCALVQNSWSAESNSKEGQSADAVLATFKGRTAVELKGTIPDVVVCGNESLPLKQALDEKAYIGVWLNQDASTVALVVPDDGEQEHGYFLQKSDLILLKEGKISELKADTFDGYWWSDGDHGTYGKPVKCTLGR